MRARTAELSVDAVCAAGRAPRQTRSKLACYRRALTLAQETLSRAALDDSRSEVFPHSVSDQRHPPHTGSVNT